MKNLTTGMLVAITLLFFISQTSKAQVPNSWDPNTYMIRFDPSISQAEIDDLKAEYFAEELWVSPLTQTRLWVATLGYPFTTLSGSDTFINVVQNSANGRSKAGSQGGSGLNYGLISGTLGLSTSVNGNLPINPNPTNPDTDIDCHSEMFTTIITENSPVNVGIFDTGLSSLEEDFGYYWSLSNNISGYDYTNGNSNYADFNGHGNHVSTSMMHLVNEAYGEGQAPTIPNVDYRIMKTFNNSANGMIAEIILAFETEVVNGMNIANFSWRFLADENEASLHPLLKSLSVAQDSYDVLFVCAAGNDGVNINAGIGYNGNGDLMNAYPAAYDLDNILSVTTFNCVDGFPSFANRGNRMVDIAAPGLEVPGYFNDNYGYSTIDYLDGTSMSTAVVSAAAIQLATHQSSFDAQDIKCAIMNSAMPNANIEDDVVSNGLLNTPGALSILGGCNKRSIGQDFGSESQIVTDIYPNPTSSDFELNLNSELAGKGTIQMLNTMGQLVFNQDLNIVKGKNSFQINPIEVQSGLYHLIIDIGEERQTKKITVIK